MCPQCQSPVTSNADFCPSCGASLRPQPGPGQARHDRVERPAGSNPAYRFDLNRLSTADRVISVASFVVFISLFLPWFSSETFAVSGMNAHGYLTFSLLAAVVLIGYLAMRAGWDKLPFRLPVAHSPLLLIGTAVQLLFVLIGFLFKPFELGWSIGAYLGLLAALTACAVVLVPATRSAQGTKQL
jgi:hypothetical protein